MTDVDLWICSRELGFVLKSEQREALELILRERMFSVFYQQDLTKALFIGCLFMQIFKFRATADRHCYLAWLKKRSVGNTRLLPHENMPLVPMNCFLCRVDYALEENVLTEQM